MTNQSLLTDISDINQNLKPGGCGYLIVLIKLSAGEQADLRTAIADPDIACSAIERALRQRGHTVSATTLRRHRRKDCSCGRFN